MSGNTDWTDDIIARLRALWNDGHSTAEIGRRMGITKNAVVGKAHRLDLPGRESPIRRGLAGPAAPRQPRPSRAVRPTLPALPSALTRPAPTPAPAPALPPPPPARRRYGPLGQPCCWPLGEPGTRGFRFCESSSEQGRPYCAEHSSLAYVPRTERHPATV